MAPMVKQLAEAHRIQRKSDALLQKAAHIIDRSESFQALLEMAMVTQLCRVSNSMVWPATRQSGPGPG